MDKALALTWHLIDAGLHMTSPHRKTRMVWAGIGVGWSVYWVISSYVQRPRLTIVKEWSNK